MNQSESGSYSIADFSRAFRVGRTFIYSEIRLGRLGAVKAGNKTLILKSEAERWAQSLPKLVTSRDARVSA